MKPTLLIIEPDPPQRIGMTMLLQRDGYFVRATGTLRGAKRELATQAIDIVISTTRFGAGRQAMKVLQMVQGAKPRPLTIFVTADSDTEAALNAVRAGAYEYLSKPVDPAHLIDLLASATKDLNRKDVFVCHSSADKKAIVRPFVRQLKARGISCWVGIRPASCGN
jgi:DNA-binding NtrC family response regulator